MTSIESIILEVPDPAAAEHFYAAAFGLGDDCGCAPATHRPAASAASPSPSWSPSRAPSTACRRRRRRRREDAQARQEELLGLRRRGAGTGRGDLEGRDVGEEKHRPRHPRVDDVVLLLGVDDVEASKQFYVDRGLAVAKSFGGKYVEFDAADVAGQAGPLQAACPGQGRRRPPDGTGSHRIVIVGAAGPFTDPDGFAWEATSRTGTDNVRAL